MQAIPHDLEENILLTKVQGISPPWTSATHLIFFQQINLDGVAWKRCVFIFICTEGLKGLTKWSFPAYSRAIHQRKVSVCTSLSSLDCNLTTVVSKLHSLWEKHSYFSSSCAFLSTEDKEGSSLFLLVHTTSAGYITNVKSMLEVQL